jgi:hypothetical protein
MQLEIKVQSISLSHRLPVKDAAVQNHVPGNVTPMLIVVFGWKGLKDNKVPLVVLLTQLCIEEVAEIVGG